jgi:hypothetical protein
VGSDPSNTTLELLLAVAVFGVVALVAGNYPKVGKPLEFFILAGLGVRAVGAMKNA